MQSEYILYTMNDTSVVRRAATVAIGGGWGTVSAPRVARVGVLGATGYTGRELIRLLSAHPRAEVAFGTSESEAGASLRSLWRGAADRPLVQIAEAAMEECDLVFSCLPHGASASWVERARSSGARVVDLSADLRVVGPTSPPWAREAVYGLPEMNREEIRGAVLVANPGCYPTAALLALGPALRRNAVSGPVFIDAASGVSGAGRSPKRELLFAEVAEDFRAYSAGNAHRHLGEMRAGVAKLSEAAPPELVFTPHLLPVRRGILETIHVTLNDGADPHRVGEWWEDDYAGEPFVEVLAGRTPSLADAVGTNRVLIGVVPVAGVSRPMITIVAAIDNLVKGAAGQAVQNMNLMLGWDEAEGLT